MPKKSFFRPGQTVVLREIWRDKLWSARPEIIVQDTPDLLAVCILPGTIWKQPQTPDGQRVMPQNRITKKYVLNDVKWLNYHRLRLAIPGAGYSVLIFWDMPGMKQNAWYINLEESLRRTAIGFDFLDQFLDVIVNPDLSSWHWKNEDEFQEAINLGLISQEKAAAIRAEGERVANWIQFGKSPFNGWEKWRPDPSWKAPVLPAGWDKI